MVSILYASATIQFHGFRCTLPVLTIPPNSISFLNPFRYLHNDVKQDLKFTRSKTELWLHPISHPPFLGLSHLTNRHHYSSSCSVIFHSHFPLIQLAANLVTPFSKIQPEPDVFSLRSTTTIWTIRHLWYHLIGVPVSLLAPIWFILYPGARVCLKIKRQVLRPCSSSMTPITFGLKSKFLLFPNKAL